MTDPVTSTPTGRLDAWLIRRGVVGVARRDLLLAVLVTAATAAFVPTVLRLAEVGEEGTSLDTLDVGLLTAVCAAQCLLLSVRRTRPVTCLLLVAAVQVLVAAVTPADVDARGPAPLLAAYAVGSLLPARVTALAVASAIGIELVGELALVDLGDGLALLALSAGNTVVTYGASALVGSDVRVRRRVTALERQRAAQAVAAEAERADAAVTAERARMARDLHDIAAHHLSGMVVQATATARLVERDPHGTRAGLLAIRQQGRRTLDDLRLLVGVLRDPAAAEGAPVPGLGVVDVLVEEARAVGTEVHLECSGPATPLAPLVDVTCYRLVQESLANARQHAPGAPVRITLDRSEGGLEMVVANVAPGVSPSSGGRAVEGVGLLGMRERVQLVGGRLESGPDGAGGWRVRAWLPVLSDEAERARQEDA